MRSMSRTFSSALFFITLIRDVNSEIFSSTALLSEAITVEREIVGQLQTYIEDSEAKISRLRNFIDAFNREPHPTDVGEVTSNPLSAYRLIKQLAIHWQIVQKQLNESFWQNLTQHIRSPRISSLIPKKGDVRGAASAILRLQETYRLNVSDLVRGTLLGVETAINLTIDDCVDLGKSSIRHGFYELAIDWYGLALRMSREEANPAIQPAIITKYLDAATKKHFKSMEYEEYRDYTSSRLRNSASTKYKLGLETSPYDESINYDALCRGEQLRSDSEVATLNCYLSDRGDASFYINPIKVEVHSHDPQIFTFHDIMYESEINFIKEFSKPFLRRSIVYRTNASTKETDTRTSQNAWVTDNEEDEQLGRKVKTIMDRMSRITGLNVQGNKNSDRMQVANYGIGGHYASHYDYFYLDLSPQQFASYNPAEYKIRGDRLATLMFYLSDVKLGGATVFPLIGAAVWPRKGSAAFWYNIHKNCTADPRTLHGGCPVLHGSKWIGNKWIREVNQVFKRPCSLNQRD